jgi:oxygen-independent coproporphyrinogen-3 oxidase
LQSSDDKILKNIGRIHRAQDFTRAVKLLKGVGITNISGDVILGLPEQDAASVVRDADFLTSAGVKHISAYALQVEEGTPLFERGFSVDPDRQADLYDAFYDRIKRSGYRRYEVSNFALPHYESRHNLKYWLRAPYLGFGVAAHSFYDGKRGYNTSSIKAYCAGARDYKESTLSLCDETEEYVMLSLRTENGLDLDKYRSLSGKDLFCEKAKEIERLSDGGFIEIDGKTIKTTDKGFYVLSSIITELL